MTQQLFKFPSIEQLRSVVATVNSRCLHSGITERPSLDFHGTVKLHGTNAAVVYSRHPSHALGAEGTVYAQSRENIITPEEDNAGFARWVRGDDTFPYWHWGTALSRLFECTMNDSEAHSVAVYGEWCGGSIQKSVALNKLSKMFVVFGIAFIYDGKVIENGEEVDGTIKHWLPPASLKDAVNSIIKSIDHCREDWDTSLHCIEDFPTYDITIDFNEPAQVQNRLVDLTIAVEAECPVSKQLGAIGTGEGIVWRCVTDALIKTSDLVFKVKGEKHSDTKTKTLAPVDIEKVNSINAAAELVGTPHRFEKGLAYLKEIHPNEDVLTNKYIGEFLKWVGQDVLKEETDTITGNGLEPKEVTKAVNNLAKNWFIEETKL